MIKIEVEYFAVEIDGQVNHLTPQEAKELQEELDNLLGPVDQVTFPGPVDQVTFPGPPTLPPQDKQPWTGYPYPYTTSNT